ncbi:hypothetical protein [Marivita sp.]|uniref:hypothetical protein n=1 Tax=Marivita sp. TaxID=2003365 RepID=UPI003218EC68
MHAALGYEDLKNSAYVKARLNVLGMYFIDGISKIKCRGTCTKVIGLPTDMHVLPIYEQTIVDHVSTHPKATHTFGRDRHTEMLLLGVAKDLSQVRDY